MIARPLVVLAAGLAATIGVATASVAAQPPAGPRLAFVEWLAEPPMTRLGAVDASGSARATPPVAGVQPVPFEGPVWTPDGSTLVYAGYPVGPDGETREGAAFRLYALAAEGGTPREIPGTRGGSHPVLSPDGLMLAFQRSKLNFHFNRKDPIAFGYYSSATTWIVPVAGGSPRRITPWRNGLANSPAAFSPDGATLLLERDRKPGWNPEVVARSLRGGPLRVISLRAEDPAFSPDGTRIAMIDYRDRITVATGDGPAAVGELYVSAADGSRSRRLTATKSAQESQPSWSPSGQRIAFVRTPGPGGLGFGSTILQANADGSCARRVTGASGRQAAALYGPAWQPGPGREADPLSC
ncbi:MAG: TolB family protein [Solirubrobacterales bacterium]